MFLKKVLDFQLTLKLLQNDTKIQFSTQTALKIA